MRRRFIIYGLTGLCLEVLWTGFDSMIKGDIRLTGSTYIWMFPIYGLALLLEFVHDRIRHFPNLIRGSVYMVLIFTGEFLAGLFLRKILGVCPWDYKNEPLAIYGIITLRYIPVWFITGLLFEKLHDVLVNIQSSIKVNG